MKQIRSDHTLLSYWELLVFLEAMLLAHAETKALAVPVTALLGRVEALMQRDLGVRRSRIQTRAIAVVAGGDIEDEVTNVRSEILYFTKQDRKSSAYTTLFKEAVSKMLKRALSGQLDVAEGIVQNLGLSLYPSDLSRKLISGMESSITKAKNALKSVEDTDFEITKLRLETQAIKQEANAVRMGVYGELLKVATLQKRSKLWVERFFDANFGESSASQAPASGTDAATDPATSTNTPEG